MDRGARRRSSAGDRARRARAQAASLSPGVDRLAARCEVRPDDRLRARAARPSASACARISGTAPLSREHVLATVVMLLEKTLIRIGNKEYARANKSFGLTTLLDRARAGQGQFREIPVPRQERRHADDRGQRRDARADRRAVPEAARESALSIPGCNTASRSASTRLPSTRICATSPGGTFTAKNFRTWAGTVLAARAVCDLPECTSERHSSATSCARSTRWRRGSATRARSAAARYIHPGVLEGYRDERDDCGCEAGAAKGRTVGGGSRGARAVEAAREAPAARERSRRSYFIGP